MIKGFKDKEAEWLFNREPSRKLPPEIQRIGLRKLRMLNRARTLGDLRVPPGNRLEALKGNRLGQYSIRIKTGGESALFGDKAMSEVEIVDYH